MFNIITSSIYTFLYSFNFLLTQKFFRMFLVDLIFLCIYFFIYLITCTLRCKSRFLFLGIYTSLISNNFLPTPDRYLIGYVWLDYIYLSITFCMQTLYIAISTKTHFFKIQGWFTSQNQCFSNTYARFL